MSQGQGEGLTRDYFRLVEDILEARGLSARELCRRIGRGEGYFSQLKSRGDLSRSWNLVEEGLGLSPVTLLSTVLCDVRYDELLAALGPQERSLEPDSVAQFSKLERLVEDSENCRQGPVRISTWEFLESLERKRFKDSQRVDVECREIVRATLAKPDLDLDDAVVAVGVLGIWSTLRRHANDRGSATQILVVAIRVSFVLGVEKLSARLLQRACYLLCDVDQYRPGEMMVDCAIKFYSNVGDLDGLGMALVDTGFVAFGVRDLERAESRVLLGAELLGSSRLHHIYKASAFQLAAKARSMRGDLRESANYLEQASKFAASYDQHWAAIRWCAGNLQFQLAQFDEAEAALREALQFYIRADKVTDIIMIVLDLAAVLLAQGRTDDVPALARYLHPILERLSERDQVRSYVEEAHACLVRARHVQALERFKETYEVAWRNHFATPAVDASR